jgi:RNA polymerase sigma-70 factor, ECF subfamily
MLGSRRGLGGEWVGGVTFFAADCSDWVGTSIGGGVEIATESEVELVFQSHAGQVWRAVMVMSAGRREIADEATAEAFARLFDYRLGVRDPVAWVFRTAFRLGAADLRRERALEAEIPDHPDVEQPELPTDLEAALAVLSPDQRVAVFLFYFADLPVHEVARLSGSTSAAVKVRLHRARRALKTLLEPVEVPYA